ncbi:uncharacterized protein [Halyomorpha halys]|uniref:uncharacterized protein n=1 Tax=Halyomorpha halys TaxID=286706 RepID=UPI0006D517CD|nr:uncharacterized protein LOC106685426 [Halyomorpha halys]
MHIEGTEDSCKSDLTKSISDLLNRGDEKIKCCLNKDLVLIIGTTGTGKSTLAQYLAGNTDRLHSKPTSSGTSFIIVDEDDAISNNSTIFSKTVFPSLVENKISDIVYCDCPGFCDTRSAAYDIAANYFINAIVDGARRVKLVFAIHHAAVEEGNERAPFMEMVKHATKFIKNIEKYKNSIALVVTKVSGYNKNGRISDEKIVGGIAGFMLSALKDLEKEGHGSSSQYERDIRFIKILLVNVNEDYEKIGIFRKPEEAGRLSELDETLEERNLLQKIVLNNIQFIETEKGDFGYTLSADSHNHVTELVNIINEEVSGDIIRLSYEVERYYRSKEDFDLELWRTTFESLYEVFSGIQTEALTNRDNDSQQYLKRVIDNIKTIDSKISEIYLKKISSKYRQLEFLKTVSERGHRVDPSCVAQGIAQVKEFFHHSSKWYKFLCKLYSILTSYSIQMSSTFNTFVLEEEDVRLSEISLDPNLYKIFNDDLGYDNIKDVILNKSKIKTFEHLLNIVLKDNVETSRPTNERLLIVGRFLKLSEIKRIFQNYKPKRIDILALNKIFIDSDLDETGNELQLTIIAPTWDIIGEPCIRLDGRSGAAHEPPKAANGGERGSAGLPGGAAGIFVAVGHQFINDEHLRVSAVGGRGGPGQDGGRGSDGQDGLDPDIPDWEDIDVQKKKWRESGFNVHIVVRHIIPIVRILEREKVDVTGTSGTSGATGGDGGRGGFGGPAGRVIIVNTSGSQTKFKVNCCNGEGGEAGSGGAGGSGGRNGHQQRVYIHRFDITNGNRKFDKIDSPRDMGRAGDGSAGSSGLSEQGLNDAPGALEFSSLKQIIETYKELLKESLNKSFEVSHLKGFYDNLENNPQVNDLI